MNWSGKLSGNFLLQIPILQIQQLASALDFTPLPNQQRFTLKFPKIPPNLSESKWFPNSKDFSWL
jgi:hypothetical protein